MKYLYTILAVLILSSCWTQNDTDITITKDNVSTEKTNNDIENEISNIDLNSVEQADDKMDNKVTKLDATYTNPQTTVDMVLDYSLDDENKIETINVSATTYDVSEFNTKLQSVVWKTLEEASEVYISGSSLATEAFHNAIK